MDIRDKFLMGTDKRKKKGIYIEEGIWESLKLVSEKRRMKFYEYLREVLWDKYHEEMARFPDLRIKFGRD